MSNRERLGWYRVWMVSKQLFRVWPNPMFVYDQFTIPILYTATLNNVGGFTLDRRPILTNRLRLGTIPFNPAFVGYRKVGAITWTAMTVTTVR